MSDIKSLVDVDIASWLVTHGLRILVVIVGAIVLNLFLKRMIGQVVRMSVTAVKHKSVEAEQKRERTLIRVGTWATLVTITIMALMMILQEIGLPIGPMLAGAGILGLAVGFGGQYLIRDYITGLLIIFENQYQIGDSVQLDSTSGVVEDISLRMTTLRDMDGTVHMVPHGDIKRVSNLSKLFSRINVNINVNYDEDLDNIIRIINEVGEEMMHDPRWKDVILKPPVFLRVDDFTETAMALKIVGETIPSRQFQATGDLRKRIKEAFDREGIQMPIIQRIVQQITSESKDSSGE